MRLYLIGALKNPDVPILANRLREEFPTWEIFDDWFAPGPLADDYWREYSKARNQTYKQALNGYAGKHIFEFDLSHLNTADIGILLMPTGKSGHLELGYMIGQGKPCYYVMEKDNPRWDIMLQLCYLNGGSVCDNADELITELRKIR